jgi:peroxiredoxin
MYHLLFLLSFLILFPFVGNNEGEFTIVGTMEGMEDTTVELIAMGQSGGTVLAQTSLQDGRFTLNGTVEHPLYAALKFVGPNKYIYFWIEASEISISADAKVEADNSRELAATITGSMEQTLMQEYLGKHREFYSEVSELVAKMREAEDPEERAHLDEKVTEARDKARARTSEYILNFARKNNDAFVAVYAMRTEINDVYNDIWELDGILDGFTDRVKESEYYKDNRERLDYLMKIQPGQPAPGFTLATLEGTDVSLSDYRGKIVLIDFWASWCQPCIAAIPDMKKIYEKYQAKGFEIIGISTDTNRDAWLRSLEQHKIPWISVIDVRPEGVLKSTVATDYSVSFLPTLIMIDKEGTIMAKNVTKEEIEKYLTEML